MNRKIADIQVLRAVAILMVMLHHIHAYLIPWQSPRLESFFAYFGGSAGVDLFFVISGFVIARNFLPRLNSAQEPQLTLLEFGAKRIFRIIPSAWFWLLAILLMSIFLNQSGAFGSIRATVEGSLAAILQVANVRLFECYARFECGATTVYWSLSLEEQFYLVFPALALLAGRRLPVLLVFYILSQFFIPWLTMPGPFRMTALALGVLMAYYAPGSTYQSLSPGLFTQLPWLRRTTLLVLLGCLAGIGGSGLNLVSDNVKFNLMALLSAALVFIASFDGQYILRDGKLKSLLCRIGDRSYALYLSHVPAFFLTRELFHRFAPEVTKSSAAVLAYMACALVLVLAFSEFSFRLIERPLQRKGAEWLKQRRQLDLASPNEINHAHQTT